MIPDHELLRRIGSGSYGEVWLARSVMGTYRAVKVVHRSSFDHERPYLREFDGIRKFEPISRSQEGQVDILHVGRNDAAGYFYCVMELADDDAVNQQINPDTYSPRTLRSEMQKRTRLPVADCVRIGLSLAQALGHLHKNGLVHRDIMPDREKLIELNAVVFKACHPDRSHRYHSAEEMQADLLQLQGGKSLLRSQATRRRLKLATYAGLPAAILLAAGLAGVVWRMWPSSEQRFHRALEQATNTWNQAKEAEKQTNFAEALAAYKKAQEQCGAAGTLKPDTVEWKQFLKQLTLEMQGVEANARKAYVPVLTEATNAFQAAKKSSNNREFDSARTNLVAARALCQKARTLGAPESVGQFEGVLTNQRTLVEKEQAEAARRKEQNRVLLNKANALLNEVTNGWKQAVKDLKQAQYDSALSNITVALDQCEKAMIYGAPEPVGLFEGELKAFKTNVTNAATLAAKYATALKDMTNAWTRATQAVAQKNYANALTDFDAALKHLDEADQARPPVPPPSTTISTAALDVEPCASNTGWAGQDC